MMGAGADDGEKLNFDDRLGCLMLRSFTDDGWYVDSRLTVRWIVAFDNMLPSQRNAFHSGLRVS